MFFKKKSFFKIFQKREQKKIWKHVIGFSFLSLLALVILYLYLLLSPFKDFFWRLPSMLGFFREKNYLVVFQNNAERRPTGGFISAYADVSFFLGSMDMKLSDSYDVPAPNPQITPPYPLEDILKDDVFYKGFVFRDGNWDIDFPTSAKMLVRLYNEGQPTLKEWDGVIAIDMSFIEKLIEVSGSIDYQGTTIDSKNFFHMMQFYSKNIDLHSVESLESRKNIMKEIIPQILSEILKSPMKYSEVIGLFKDLLDTKHMLVYFENTSLQEKVVEKKWGAKFEPRADDFIAVNVANIGGRKADRYIQPQYSYRVFFDELSRGYAELDLDFYYNGTQGLYTDFYQSYVRVSLPKNISQLESWGDNRRDFIEETDVQSLTVGTLMHIWPGEKQSLHFRYQLPEYISPYNYNVDIIPMPGNEGELWSIALRNKNTDNFWDSQSFQSQENVASFSSVLYKDTLFSANLLNDETSPVIIWQKFLDNKTIELSFSEKIDQKTLIPDNFLIQDMNISHKELEENPKVVSVYQDDNYRVYIKLQDISWQYNEFFELTLKNISDISGNIIQENPKFVTVVQR